MQLTETVTIINKSGKVISNGKQIVNIFKEAKAAYQDKKAALKAERAAETRPGVRKAQTYSGPGPEYHSSYGGDHVYDGHTHVPHYLDEGNHRQLIDDVRSHATSRRSHGSHRSKRTRDKSGKSARPPLTENNLRTLSEVSSTTPSQVPRSYRASNVETAQGDNNVVPSRPRLVHAPTAPVTMALGAGPAARDVDMNLAYGDVPPDLASRTDLGPAAHVEEECEHVEDGADAGAGAGADAEVNKQAEARTLMERIEALLDEAECVHHTATSIIDHLQRKPEAAAAVALLLAELSTVLKAVSPGFLGVVKGGFPAIFALLASPQFLVGVGVAVGVTVVCFGGWKIVKQIREAKAAGVAKEKAFEMQQQQQQQQQEPQAAAVSVPPAGEGQQQQGFDDALVLEEELGAIETWRRGIAAPDDYELASAVESADLELITPEAARSVRDDGRSIRTTRTHRSSKSHGGHKSRKHKDGDAEVSRKKSSRSKAADIESVADSERTRRSSRPKAKTITDGADQDDNTLDVVLRPKDKKPSMLKTMFKKKRDRDDGRESSVSVMA